MLVGNSLVVQWLGLRAFTVEGVGSIPGRGTKILQAVQCGQKKRMLVDRNMVPIAVSLSHFYSLELLLT